MKRKVSEKIQTRKGSQGLAYNDTDLGRYFGGAALIVFAIFILLSLYSYSPLDNCINVASSERTRNICGSYGAIVADLMLQVFGLSSWLVVVLSMVWSFVLLSKGGLEKMFFFGRRFALGAISLVFMSSCLGFLKDYNFSMKMMLGGYVGYCLSGILASRLGNIVGFILSMIVSATSLFFALKGRGGILSSILLVIKRIFGLRFLKKTLKIIVDILTLRFIFKLFRHKESISISIDELFWQGAKHSHKTSKPSGAVEQFHVASDADTDHTSLKVGELLKENTYRPPDIGLLRRSKKATIDIDDDIILQRKNHLLEVLRDFSVNGEILSCSVGPVISLFELKPTAGTKASRVVGLASDVARTMRVPVVRIADVPAKGVIGIELPNPTRAEVNLRDIIESAAYDKERLKIPIVLGKDTMGNPLVEDLTKMPHLLIAGTTGSGKSVGVNAMILSILYALSPEECKFVMIDPKMLELSLYDGIPHLLSPVITDPKGAIVALKWVVSEMLSRYKKMSNLGVRNIAGYNQKASIAKMRGAKIVRDVEVGYNAQTGDILTEKVIEDAKTMPYIVVVIDEMADLMVASGKEVEVLVQRIAQMARAAGIHVIMATQRPSVDVITGVIKANFPTRISYQVTSRIDSRTILGEQGAEQLLGLGDMLYSSLGKRLKRAHGPFVSEEEVESVVRYLRENYSPEYIDIMEDVAPPKGDDIGSSDSLIVPGDAELYKQAIKIVLQTKKTSISYVQRQLRIGYNKAANFIEQMQKDGILKLDELGRRFIIDSDFDS